MHGKRLNRYIDLNISPRCNKCSEQADLSHFPCSKRLDTGRF